MDLKVFYLWGGGGGGGGGGHSFLSPPIALSMHHYVCLFLKNLLQHDHAAADVLGDVFCAEAIGTV